MKSIFNKVMKAGVLALLPFSAATFASGIAPTPIVGNEDKADLFGDLTILGISDSGQSLDDFLASLSGDSLSVVDSLEWDLDADGYAASSASGELSVEVTDLVYGYDDGVAGTWEYTGSSAISTLVFELSGGEFVAVDAAGLTGGDWDIGAFAIQSGWTCCGDESTSKAHHLVALSAYQVTEIPVPASIVLFGSALAGLVARRRS